MKRWTFVLVVAAGGLAATAACKKQADQPGGQTPSGYDQYGNPIYTGGQQGQYPPQPYGQPTGYPPQPYGQPTGYPPATNTAPPQPANPLSPPCQSDASCFTHRCNLQTQHCAIPCASGADCQPGSGCIAGACIPGAPAN